MSFAQITLIGRLGKDPEVKMTQTGKQLVTTSLAVTVGKDKQSNWYTLNVWNEALGKILIDAQKGDQVFVQGNLELRTYDKKTGGQGYELFVNAQTIRTFKPKSEQPDYSQPGSKPAQDVPFDDQIPF